MEKQMFYFVGGPWDCIKVPADEMSMLKSMNSPIYSSMRIEVAASKQLRMLPYREGYMYEPELERHAYVGWGRLRFSNIVIWEWEGLITKEGIVR